MSAAEILAYLAEQDGKPFRSVSDRLPDKGGAGTHPAIYAHYLAYLETGLYPYIADVQAYIAERVPGLPAIDRHKPYNEQPGLLKQLGTEIYVASNCYRADMERSRAAELQACGYVPLEAAEIVAGRRYSLVLCTNYVGSGVAWHEPVHDARPVFADGALTGFLPKGKRTHGYPMSSLSGALVRPEAR